VSLTSELGDAGSPIRAYVDGVSPRLARTRGTSPAARAMAETLGLVALAASNPIVPAPADVDTRRSGTAFDIRTRIALGDYDIQGSASAAGIARVHLHADETANGHHRAKILTETFQIAKGLISRGPDDADLDLASILLAPAEQVYYGGMQAFTGSLGAACDTVNDGRSFADAITPSALADIRSLREKNSAQVTAWRGRVVEGARLDPHPAFSGAMLVGGADGDWLVGDTLIDCKVYAELNVSTLRGFLRQLLGYVMLDLNDALAIRRVGLWLPRQGLTPTWSLEDLLGGDPEELLPGLREGFVAATSQRQVAVHVPVSERRKLQLLADNRHTPQAMLLALALGDDADLRCRVGRNPTTSRNTLDTLSADYYAHVRKGVAMNPATPPEMLSAFDQDTSMTVRRAAAANPRTPRREPDTRPHALQQSPVTATGLSEITQELVRPSAEQAAALPADLVQIRQDRDRDRADLGMLQRLIPLFIGRPLDGRARLPLPRASRIWAGLDDRTIDVPASLTNGLPDAVKHALMHTDQPSHIRRVVATTLPIDDVTVRTSLFTDNDPDVRWSALKRSTTVLDDAMTKVLRELASSRAVRVSFRDQGVPANERWYTSAEYNREVLALVASHPATPPDTLRELIKENASEVLTALAENPALDDEGAELLASKILSARSTDTRVSVAQSHRVRHDMLVRLAQDRSIDVRRAVAWNNATPAVALRALADDKSMVVRLEVLGNSNLPSEVATELAKGLLTSASDLELLDLLESLGERGDVTLPGALVEDAVDRLSKSRVRNPDLRLEAAEHPGAGLRTLLRLARSSDQYVRRAIAESPRTPESILAMLARDDLAAVRRSTASNPNTPEDALTALLLDPDLDVRIAAFRNPAADTAEQTDPDEITDEIESAPRPTAALIPDLHQQAAHSHAEVRLGVAFNPSATPDILAFLGGERRSSRVRRAVAANPNTPGHVLSALADETDLETQHSVAFNSATPIETLVNLAGRGSDLALLVALNPDVPMPVLDALTRDADPLIKFVALTVRAERALARTSTSTIEGAGTR